MTGWPLLEAFLSRGLWPVYLVLAVSAFVKYALPFLPGDFVMLVALFFVGHQDGSWIVAVLCITAGGTAGAYVAFLWGGHFGSLLMRWQRMRDLTVRVEDMLGRWGYWPIVLNRFIPYVRPAILPAAGLMRMKAGPVVLSAAVSNVLFAVLAVALGYSAGHSYGHLKALYTIYQFWLGLAVLVLLSLGALLLFHAARRVVRARRAGGNGDAGPS